MFITMICQIFSMYISICNGGVPWQVLYSSFCADFSIVTDLEDQLCSGPEDMGHSLVGRKSFCGLLWDLTWILCSLSALPHSQMRPIPMALNKIWICQQFLNLYLYLDLTSQFQIVYIQLLARHFTYIYHRHLKIHIFHTKLLNFFTKLFLWWSYPLLQAELCPLQNSIPNPPECDHSWR